MTEEDEIIYVPNSNSNVRQDGNQVKNSEQTLSRDADGIYTSTIVFTGKYFDISNFAKNEEEHPDLDWLLKTNFGVQRQKGNLGRATITYKGVPENSVHGRWKVKSSVRSEPIETHPHFLIGREISDNAETLKKNESAYGYKFGEEIFGGVPKGSKQAFYDIVDTNKAFKLFPKTAKFDLPGVTSYLELGMIVQATIVSHAGSGVKNAIGTSADNGGYIYRVGQIEQLPSFIDIDTKNIEKEPNRFSWLVSSCNLEIMGTALRQEVEFTLSGPKGWNRLIYKQSNSALGGNITIDNK